MEEIRRLCDTIVRLIQPEVIILFGRKLTLSGEISSFKLCIVASGNAGEIEGKLYLETDCPVHFDVLVYSPEDWKRLGADSGSFAHRILSGGSVLYEKA